MSKVIRMLFDRATMFRGGMRPRSMVAGRHLKRGSIAFGVLAVAAVVLELGAATLYVTSGSMQRARREENQVISIHAAEAGLQAKMDQVWTAFKVSQSLQTAQSAANTTLTGTVDGGMRYEAHVPSSLPTPPDTYSCDLWIYSTGWFDRNGNGQLDDDEPRRTIKAKVRFSLARAGVFDYAYFVNNYGWMTGFGANDLIVNGDMRANGNFDFSGGTPTINGSVYAAPNDRLIPPAVGSVNITPNQWSNSYYEANASSRARQAYNSTKHGARGSSQFANWRDIIYDHDAYNIDDVISGAVVGDKNGVKSYGGTVLDPEPTTTLPMPDLSDLSRYSTLSNTYVDSKQTYGDGTANPGYGQGAYLDVWNSSTSSYQRLTTNGVVTGSATIIGDSTHPIKIHGPVTITQDAIVKGVVQGQGTIYTGRNVHIVGSITYKDPPDFTGSNPQTIDNANEKKTLLGLAARASIIMGDTSQFGSYPLDYMTPPFTHPRYDDNGNYVAAYDARQTDSYGVKKYQSVLGDTAIHNVASNVGQIDAVLYTNFLGGGNIGTGGGGVTFNGSIISRDEAMVLFSLPFRMNYDNRIKERSLNGKPLVDIDLPRTPSVQLAYWHEVHEVVQ